MQMKRANLTKNAYEKSSSRRMKLLDFKRVLDSLILVIIDPPPH